MCKLLEHTINNGDKRLSDIIVKGERRVDHETGILYYPSPPLFSTRRICSREQRKKQLDWLVTNTDDITSQSHSLFACSREQVRQVENRLNKNTFTTQRFVTPV